jgi:hypothetical protein
VNLDPLGYLLQEGVKKIKLKAINGRIKNFIMN